MAVKNSSMNHILEKLVGDRFRERPSDCNIDSHALMVRGGYMKYVTNGIFSSYMPLFTREGSPATNLVFSMVIKDFNRKITTDIFLKSIKSQSYVPESADCSEFRWYHGLKISSP